LVQAAQCQLGAAQNLGVGFVPLLGIAALGFFAKASCGTGLFGEIEPLCGESAAGFTAKVGERSGQSGVVDHKREVRRRGFGALVLLRGEPLPMLGDACRLARLRCGDREESGSLAADLPVVGGEFFEIRRVEEEGIAAHVPRRLATSGEQIALARAGVEHITEVVFGRIEGHAEADGANEPTRVGIVARDVEIAPTDAAVHAVG
jgi:hypothetical protein